MTDPKVKTTPKKVPAASWVLLTIILLIVVAVAGPFIIRLWAWGFGG